MGLMSSRLRCRAGTHHAGAYLARKRGGGGGGGGNVAHSSSGRRHRCCSRMFRSSMSSTARCSDRLSRVDLHTCMLSTAHVLLADHGQTLLATWKTAVRRGWRAQQVYLPVE